MLVKLTSTPIRTAKSLLKSPPLDGMHLHPTPSSLTGMLHAHNLASNAPTSPDGLRLSNPTALLLISLCLLTTSLNASTLLSRFQSPPLLLSQPQECIAPSPRLKTPGLVTLVKITETAWSSTFLATLKSLISE
jgi:hypothetical protein